MWVPGVTSESDKGLFRQFIGDVEPLSGDQKAPRDRSSADTAKYRPGVSARRHAAQGQALAKLNFLADLEHVKRIQPWEVLEFKRDGVQHAVYRNLKRGRYPSDATLDLHRHTINQARTAVFQFINDCLRHDIRCCTVVHGRGDRAENKALLKSCVNHWLRQFDEVLAFHSATPAAGGSGSTCVLLKKSRGKKEENREKYATGRQE